MHLSVWAAVHPSVHIFSLDSNLSCRYMWCDLWFGFHLYHLKTDIQTNGQTDGQMHAYLLHLLHCVSCCFLVWNGQQAKFAVIVDSMTIVTAVGLPIHSMYVPDDNDEAFLHHL